MGRTRYQLYDKLETQLRGLESLGVSSDKYAAMLYPLVESALPDEILKTWQRSRIQTKNREEEDQLKLLMKFLRNEVDSEIRLNLARTCIFKDIENSIEFNSVSMLASNSAVVKTDVCYFCKKSGHIKPHCTQFKKWLDKKNQKETNEVNANEEKSANIAQDSDEYDNVLSIGNLRANKWILDSGATRHACHNKNHFKTLDKSYRGRILGIGSVILKLVNEHGKVHTATVNNVLYVPTLIGSMLSISRLTSLNYKIEFGRLFGELKYNNVQIGVADLTSNGTFTLRESRTVDIFKNK